MKAKFSTLTCLQITPKNLAEEIALTAWFHQLQSGRATLQVVVSQTEQSQQPEQNQGDVLEGELIEA